MAELATGILVRGTELGLRESQNLQLEAKLNCKPNGITIIGNCRYKFWYPGREGWGTQLYCSRAQPRTALVYANE